MRKKLWMCLATFTLMLFTGFIYWNYTLNAAPASVNYYGFGDNFERTNTDSFTMGGIEWKLVYAYGDKGWLMSKDNIAPRANCSDLRDGLWVEERDVLTCLNTINNYYQASIKNTDSMGEVVLGSSPINTLGMMSLEDYFTMTKDGEDISCLDGIDTTFTGSTFGDFSSYVVFAQHNMTIGQTKRVVIGGKTYKYLLYNDARDVFDAINPFIEINLPQKGIIKNIMADKTSITKSYTDPINDTGNTMISIDTSEGEGPYHFYLYDTDASGHGTYTTPSNYFTLDPDSANGTAKVNLINKLPAGDYYFKVKVVDESTNERLYYEPSDFTKDPYRTKETGVIHVQITKVSPTIAFDNPSQTKKSVQDATMATNWNETATANPFNSDLQIKYTIVSGDIGLID
ncbi:MAG: hypothetical protein HFE67_03740, partial [Erysipelotrichaceae bacterium]|nr:hypothetical protein [Erysipelotrichaceae bacterium]